MTSQGDVILPVGSTDGFASESTPLSPNTIQRRPSLTRRSSVTNITQYIPANIANNVPFLPSSSSNILQETYFCYICFMNNPKNEGFILTNCGHIFCRECIKGYMTSRINDGRVFLKCFHPPIKLSSMSPLQLSRIDQIQSEYKNNALLSNTSNNNTNNDDNNNNNNDTNNTEDNNNNNGIVTETCHQEIDELDIKACIDLNIWEKYERFKINIENPNARQCPFCEHTQFGSKDNPIMKCENMECNKEYCFFHSNAHEPSEPCESYDARMLKQNKLNEARINQRAKRCPGCNFPIEKISGCNHMRCIKCQTSFCWICEQIIDDAPVPSHYKDPDSACHGKQFEGSIGERPPMWVIVFLAIYVIIFGLPTLLISIILGLLFWPFAYCVGWCVPEERIIINSKAKPRPRDVIGGCWFSWMVLFLFIVLIPICIIGCLYQILLLLPCCKCLPNCFEIDEEELARRRNAANPLGYEADTAELES